VDYGQGYHLGRPGDVETVLAAGNAAPASSSA
jgi:hypothetical protein